jgi:predicted Zn-dependent peptidase
MFAVGSEWLYRRRYRSMQDDLDDVAALTVAEVSGVLARYSLAENTTISVGPGKGIGD